MSAFWKFKFEVGQGLATVIRSGETKEIAETRARRAVEKSFPNEPRIRILGRWRFDPPPSWFAMDARGRATRNAAGALCCQVWPLLATVPEIELAWISTRWLVVGILLVWFAASVLVAWILSRMSRRLEDPEMGRRGETKRVECPVCDLPVPKESPAFCPKCEFHLPNGEEQS